MCKHGYTLGSTEKLYIKAEFARSLCTEGEEGMLNATETAACYLFEFY